MAMAFRFSLFLRAKYNRPPLENVFLKLAECDSQNFKRFETIGESFIKLLITEYCYHETPNQDLKSWHDSRERQMDIKNLAKLGREYGIDRWITTTNWLTNGCELVAKNQLTEIQTSLSVDDDKLLASHLKAVIGIHLIFNNNKGSDDVRKFMKSFKLDVLTKKPCLQVPDRQHAILIEKLYTEKKFKDLEETLYYAFKNKSLLVQAFTHYSYNDSSIIGIYRILEFYGDAVLDYVITRYFFEHQMFYSCETITKFRSLLTNNIFFASLSKEINLNGYFLWNSNSSVPETSKIHANLFESLAAAVYLDSGMNLLKTRKVFFDLMRPSIDKEIHNISLKPIQELMENYKPLKIETDIRGNVFEVKIFYKSLKEPFIGNGISLLSAQTDAARKALKYIDELKKMYEEVISDKSSD
uniref:RNase III domain-containing protein n=1 Tax=Panagrolaimus sp. ES5 TaxID=591445 RepID=A0AC34F9M1_9BILA